MRLHRKMLQLETDKNAASDRCIGEEQTTEVMMVMRCLIRMLSMFLLLTLLLPAALAEDVCTVKDASAATHVTTGCSYLQVRCPLPEETDVTLSVRDEWGSLIYQRYYAACSGTFRSSDIHLPVDGESCDYTVTVSVNEAEYVFTVTREQPMLTDTAVYAGGLTLEEMFGGDPYKYAVVLDLYDLNESTFAAPMLAGGMEIGAVLFSVADGVLTVQQELFVEGDVDKANVYVATDAITAQTLGTKRFTGMKAKMGQEIHLRDASYAAVMVQLTVTYDPDGAMPFHMGTAEEETWLAMQEIWQLMQMTTANEANG